MKPILSIIIPTYNCEPYIQKCIDSVTSQLPQSCELILIDDGSTDDTADIINKARENRPNVHVFCYAHQNASSARNAGIDAARGKYICFLDCDDKMHDRFLEEAMKLLDGDLDLYIFGIKRIFRNRETEAWTVRDHIYPSVSAFADAYIRDRHLLVYSNCNKLYKRSLIEKYHIRFDESCDFGEDRLFNYAYIEICKTVRTSSLIKHDYYERGPSSLSSKTVSGYFDKVMSLHRRKMECFLSLSEACSDAEKADFAAYDQTNEIEFRGYGCCAVDCLFSRLTKGSAFLRPTVRIRAATTGIQPKRADGSCSASFSNARSWNGSISCHMIKEGCEAKG